ncbi:hypothetical protein [Burkholderia lata]|uniref:hypothetical protein n=1 Tax=Burkholderia lata (strain ATCC 17760 / DSM 23089 / LMG 22485 / NCIMB 9086 / R18194 / 383) TaxID=482957 RepID=UPI0015822FD9|nr:hypothetical protein [Burkholderia lata]
MPSSAQAEADENANEAASSNNGSSRREAIFTIIFLESTIETGATVGPVDLPLTYQENIVVLHTLREISVTGNIDAGRACAALRS